MEPPPKSSYVATRLGTSRSSETDCTPAPSVQRSSMTSYGHCSVISTTCWLGSHEFSPRWTSRSSNACVPSTIFAPRSTHSPSPACTGHKCVLQRSGVSPTMFPTSCKFVWISVTSCHLPIGHVSLCLDYNPHPRPDIDSV
jgi:hypothetical protein